MVLPINVATRAPRWGCLVSIVSLFLTAQANARGADTKPRATKPAGASSATEEPPAGPDTSRAGRERAAKRACLTGDADGGVALLTDLYIDTNDPTYLFNQGRCFEQNRRYEDAIGRFREYLIKAKGLGPGERAETEQHIAACESYLRGRPEPTAPPPPATPTVDTPPTQKPEPPAGLLAVPEPRPARTGTGLRTAGLVVGAVGAAGLATGLVLNLKANGMSSDLEEEYDPGVDSTRKRYKTGAWIGYGAGAACLAGGVVLYSLGLWRGKKAVALVPTVGPDMAGTALLGAF